jgi:hypothetical protein
LFPWFPSVVELVPANPPPPQKKRATLLTRNSYCYILGIAVWIPHPDGSESGTKHASQFAGANEPAQRPTGTFCRAPPGNVTAKLHYFRAVSALFSKEVFATPCATTTCKITPHPQRNSWLTLPSLTAASPYVLRFTHHVSRHAAPKQLVSPKSDEGGSTF